MENKLQPLFSLTMSMERERAHHKLNKKNQYKKIMIIIKEIQEQEREKIGWLIIRWTMTQVIVLILHSLWIVK